MAAASCPPPPATLSDLRRGASAWTTTTFAPTSLQFLPGTSAASPRRRSSSVASSSHSERGALTACAEEVEERTSLRRGRRRLNPNEIVLEPSAERSRRKAKVEKKGSKGGGRNEVSVKEEEEEVDRRRSRTTHKLLKVLGGKAKRKKLLSPAGMDVRPMMEVVKGAAFDILQAAGGFHASLRPGRWLDLYSGTGSVGIEALSRGCSEVHFVEMDPWVVSDVLRPNLEWTGFLDVSVIHTIPVERFLQQAERNTGRGETFDYISVTPPYTQVDYELLMAQILSSSLVGEDTFMVVEYPLGLDMLDSCGSLAKIADRRFGRTNLAIYGPAWANRRK